MIVRMDASGTLPFDYANAKPKRPVRVLALITKATCTFGMGVRFLGGLSSVISSVGSWEMEEDVEA